MWTPKIIEVLFLMLLIQGSHSANYFTDYSANYSANSSANDSANYSSNYSANLTRVAKCCDLGQVYDEMSSQCAPGNFNLTTLRSQYMADAGIGMGVVFDTGAMKAEDCENGSLRCVHLVLGRVKSTRLNFQNGVHFAKHLCQL
jgi:hypothetical protein